MNLNDLVTDLEFASSKLAHLLPNDPTRFDLEIQISQIKKEIVAESFNVTADFAAIHAADLQKLHKYVQELKDATTAEQVSPGIIGKILGIVKLVAPITGI